MHDTVTPVGGGDKSDSAMITILVMIMTMYSDVDNSWEQGKLHSCEGTLFQL